MHPARLCLPLALLLCMLPPAFAGDALDGTWQGQAPDGTKAELTIERSSVSDFTWRGRAFDDVGSKSSAHNTRLVLTFPHGSATMKQTAAGADLTIREPGRSTALVHLTPR